MLLVQVDPAHLHVAGVENRHLVRRLQKLHRLRHVEHQRHARRPAQGPRRQLDDAGAAAITESFDRRRSARREHRVGVIAN
jgi:hypothetical protein